MIDLRPYQLRAIDAVRERYRRGVRRVLLVMPTGSGKTHAAAAIIASAVERRRRVIFLVHRREIILDTQRRLSGLGVYAGVVLASSPADPLAPVQVASVQTLTARELTPPGDLIIWDECHHASAATYVAIAERYPTAHHLGLTATPMRADHAGLGDAFDDLVVGATPTELLEGGYLAPCDALVPIGEVRSASALGEPLGGFRLALDPVDAIDRYAADRTSIVFQRSVLFSRECTARGGPRWAHLDGTTPLGERSAILARFARGDLSVLSNVFVVTEGFDAPNADCVVLARNFTAECTYRQAVGRVLRVTPALPDKRALIVDLSDNVQTHGLPYDDREFSLHKRKSKPPSLYLCPACGAVRRRSTEALCWRCSVPYPIPAAQDTEPDIAGTELVSVSECERPITDAEQAQELCRLVQLARYRGFKRGFVAHKFKEKFGKWPPWKSIPRDLGQ